MALNAIKTTAGYVVEGTDCVGKDVELFFDSCETAQYDRLLEAESSYLKNEEYAKARAALPDPERDLYITIFGKDDEPADTALHTTLVEVQKERNGISLDWTGSPVTVALRLIAKGEGSRLRLIAGQLVDMGHATPVTSVSGQKPDPSEPTTYAGQGNSSDPAVGQQFRS